MTPTGPGQLKGLGADATRAQLTIDNDRAGHEGEEWDASRFPTTAISRAHGCSFAMRPFPGRGLALSPGSLSPRDTARALHPAAALAAATIVAAAAGAALWFGLLLLSFYGPTVVLPERLLERGPYLQVMNATSYLARFTRRRDWVEHAAIDIYNGLAERRQRRVQKGELLVLIPRCLSKETLDGVLEIAGRYEVPVFVATRGQLARRVIRERRPRAVVAVACERDMMTGLRDVAGKLPVLGLTMQLPNGPCRDAVLDLGVMDRWVRSLVGKTS